MRKNKRILFLGHTSARGDSGGIVYIPVPGVGHTHGVVGIHVGQGTADARFFQPAGNISWRPQ